MKLSCTAAVKKNELLATPLIKPDTSQKLTLKVLQRYRRPNCLKRKSIMRKLQQKAHTINALENMPEKSFTQLRIIYARKLINLV